MADLTEAEILTLAKAAGVSMPPELVTEVGYSLNGLLETLSRVEVPGLDAIEALPILPPPTSQAGSTTV
ncbi:MAG TPA: hypothetical protein VIH59_09935 [Candidatus Tectomicrobia bacterium]|jgi:hypothetical protein